MHCHWTKVSVPSFLNSPLGLFYHLKTPLDKSRKLLSFK